MRQYRVVGRDRLLEHKSLGIHNTHQRRRHRPIAPIDGHVLGRCVKGIRLFGIDYLIDPRQHTDIGDNVAVAHVHHVAAGVAVSGDLIGGAANEQLRTVSAVRESNPGWHALWNGESLVNDHRVEVQGADGSAEQGGDGGIGRDADVEFLYNVIEGWLFNAGGAGDEDLADDTAAGGGDDSDEGDGVVVVGYDHGAGRVIIRKLIGTVDRASRDVGCDHVRGHVDDLDGSIGVADPELVAICDHDHALGSRGFEHRAVRGKDASEEPANGLELGVSLDVNHMDSSNVSVADVVGAVVYGALVDRKRRCDRRLYFIGFRYEVHVRICHLHLP